MTLRVLVVTPWFPNEPTDQSGNFILHSVEALRRAGVTISVLVVRPWTPKALGLLHSDWVRPRLRRETFDPSLGLQVAHYASIPRGYWNEVFGPLFRWGTRRAILRRARTISAQLIHAHTEMVGYGVAPIARALGVPLIISLHGINTNPRLQNSAWKRARLRGALGGAERVVLVGEPLRAYFATLAGRDDHFRVVPNGFAVPHAPHDAAVRPTTQELRFCSVSNLHEGKGIDLTLQALAQLAEAGCRDWTYAIVGGGRERERLETMADALGLRDKVTFHGAQPHDRAMELLARGDVFVLPSYREAFGIAYLEAMALGLLAIAVAGQGPEAFITHGATGLLVPPMSADALFRALRSVYKDRTGVQRIAAAGCDHVLSEFTWDRHAEKLVAVYREAVSE